MNLTPEFVDDKNLRAAIGFFQVANQLKEKGFIDRSIVSYKKALDCVPNAPQVHNNLGLAYMSQGSYLKALRSFKMATEQDPEKDDYIHNLAVLYNKLGEYKEAIELYKTIISRQTQPYKAYYNLASLYKEIDDKENALFYFEKVIVANCDYVEEAKYMIAILTNNREAKKSPKSYVERLFDYYAHAYDKHLLKKLRFRIPSYIGYAFMDRVVDKTSPFITKESILDLGCGTGLCAATVRPYTHFLKGVDLSTKMLDQADRHGLYDALECADLETYLENDESLWDVILASDVLIYLGDLKNLFFLVSKRLKKGGCFIFSLEIKNEDEIRTPYVLNSSGRFSHTYSYIKNLADEHFLDFSYEKEFSLRMESSNPIFGSVVVISHLETY